MELDNRPSWLSRAMNKNTPTKGRATVQTRSEYVTDLGGEVIYPTLRMGKDGKLRDADIDEAINKKDYILVKGPLGKETADKATAKSKQISKQIGIARQMKQGGVMAKAKKARAGLGVLPMTKKTTNPSGNKNQPVQKIPQTGAAPKVVDPRDEAIKLVSKKIKQDKQDKKETTGTPVPIPTPTPEKPVPLVPPMEPMQPDIPDDESPPIPVKMKKGGMKDKKGLAVVIGMEPSYEEASKGTPQDPPPGATADEVKDDQHVLLSEGELVVPANVVRYHGLGLYEGLRRDALQGLGEMEQSGQVEYVNDEPKKAAAGLALASGPSVATTSGIAQQQQQYNPSLGLYGTATTPQAASAKYMTTNFVDRNKDGISDNLQPSINRGIVAPANYIAPANLALGPVTNPNMVVGAPNVRSYEAKQTQNVGSGTSAAVTADSNTEAMRRPLVQQPQYDSSSGGEQSEEAIVGGARTTINGIDYAIQYDFQGNITGLANVAESMKAGRPNFFEPSNELKGLISTQTKGQNAQLRGMVSPISKGLGYIDERLAFDKDADKNIQAARAATDTLNRYTGTMSRQEEMAKPDIIYGDAAIDDLEMGFTTPRVDAPKVETSEVKSGSSITPEFLRSIIPISEEEKAQREFENREKNKLIEDRKTRGTFFEPGNKDAMGIEDEESIVMSPVDQESRNRYGQTREEEERGVQLGLSRGFNPQTVAPGTATNAALTGKGYSESGAAPKGSQFSSTGKFSTSRSDDDGGGGVQSEDLGGGRGAGRTGEGTEGVDKEKGKGIQTSKEVVAGNMFADDAATADTGKDDCVIATHGLSTGGFTIMEKAKAELWCLKTYHGKWYGEAFRRGYRAAGMKHINAGTAPDVYQEFKDFVAYGRGIKKGWKAGLNYYLRTLQFFLTGLFLK